MSERHGGLEFGLTHLVRAFHLNWRYEGSDIEVLTSYVDRMPTDLVEAALVDALRVADPAVPAWVFETLWLVGTERSHDLRAHGREPAAWLQQIIGLCRGRLEKEGWSSPRSALPSPYGRLTGSVLDEITVVSAALLESALRDKWTYVPGVVPALSHVAGHACPDLAFRFLLRALTLFGPQITRGQYERYVALGAQFEYGELLVEGYDHLVD
ncbi:hypothetical protein GCM10009665_75310 [Kitasatospora nipponensis]|uniref:Uncharacterized protein n=1 Tax=Kitasatospora nipponensis TaxID=258049 RepID=A0ABN1T7H4_9ACTN